MSRLPCDDCVYCSYDEEYDAQVCEQAQDMDEDEMAHFLSRSVDACPFYRPGESDYYLAGKQ